MSSSTHPPLPRGELIVRFTDVGKVYRRYEKRPFIIRDVLWSLVGRRPKHPEFWPLRHVTFDVRAGEMLGILGANGSGKSTLLRLMAGAAFPTEGQISVRGRIAPLLSLGTGFLPDMTGRECVEVNATALGLTHDEIQSRLESILEFAELTQFVDTPIRYYSSGMVSRLGFSVAAHTKPDLFILDEVLSVGDAGFQQKCALRIAEMRKAGTTIVFVSHDAESVRKLCDRAIILADGSIVADGAVEEVVTDYLSRFA